MADDPLSRFRQRIISQQAPVQPAASPPALVVHHAPDGRPHYQAFAAKDKITRLDIRCKDLAHAVAYNYLLNVSYNRKTYTELLLTVSGMTVAVKGRALRPVVDALKLGACEFIQEYDPDEFAAPTDPAAPMIESIQVEVIMGRASAA